jgi:hypothetical protein
MSAFPAGSSPHASLDPAAASGRRYRVFLSYSHTDTKWARWLMRRLEGYAVPARFHGRAAPIGTVSRRVAPVFRDRDELPTTSDLGETIRQALRESATLVVICSPDSARSRWVQQEILAFKRLHGERSVFAFIVRGEPKAAGAADDCFSPALRAEADPDGQVSTRPAEVVAADARPEGDGPAIAFIRLMAGLLGVGFDDLRQRELQRRNRRLLVIATCAVAGMAVTLGLAAFAWHSRNEAVLARNDAQRRQDQAEELHAYMLGDVRKEVERVGRLDALEAVFNASFAYFNSAHASDLTDTALARQAKMLTQLGEIRMKQARYPDADRAFRTAYGRAAALAARHPRNADMLFERAQAEYYVGYGHYRQGQHEPAAEWLTRYRDSSLALALLEPNTLRSQREVAAGHHNLAALEKDRGRFAAARAALEAELATVTALSAAHPQDFSLEYRVADVNSWLASVALGSGDLAEALAKFSLHVTQLEALCARDPGTVKWQVRLVDGLALQGEALTVLGRRAEARTTFKRGHTLAERLAARDPKNKDWLLAALTLKIRAAALSVADADWTGALEQLQTSRAALQELAAAEPTRRSFNVWLVTGWRLEAACLPQIGAARAGEAANRACELGEALHRKVTADDLAATAELAQACVTAANLARQKGDAPNTRRHAARALALVERQLPQATHWRLLDPAARALALLGRADESTAVRARLAKFGYQPLEPWPAPAQLPLPLNPTQ